MISKSQLVFFSPDELIIFYIGLFNKEYGNKKGEEVITKIIFSKKIKNFIHKLRFERLTPGEEGFITTVNTIPYFLFSKAETLGYVYSNAQAVKQ